MSTTLRDVLAQRATDVGKPELDFDDLVARGEHRLRRRRTAAVLGAAAAMMLVLAIALVVVTLNGPVKRGEGPVDHPTVDHHPTTPVRQIVYSDLTRGMLGHTIHLGDRPVATGAGFVHMDVTDDGFVYTDRGSVWFSDGGKPERIGSDLCSADSNGEFALPDSRAVMSGNAGSSVAWFDCSRPRRPALVVFDTGSLREVARRTLSTCRGWCELVDVTSASVYFDVGGYAGYPSPEYRLELSTQRVRATTQQRYAEDITRHARGLVFGDSWKSGVATNGLGWTFRAVDSRLVPQVDGQSETHASRAFDTATGRALHLRLPQGYGAPGGVFDLFEWLDDDTVAVVSRAGVTTGDILTCRVSDGRCVLAVPAPKGGAQTEEDPTEAAVRIVPSFPLPG